jgi:hypothetical protein
MKRPLLPQLLRLLVLLPCLLMVAVRAEPEPKASGKPDPEMEADFARWLTLERCESERPAWVFDRYLVEGNKAWKSAAGEEAFLKMYAEVLAKRVDGFYPEARELREMLVEVSGKMLKFLEEANGDTVSARETTKWRAEVEWWLSEGFKRKFELWEPADYTHDDLLALARLYQRTHAHHMKKGRDLSGLVTDVLEPALAMLAAGEKEMSKEQISYFRAKVAAMIAGYL